MIEWLKRLKFDPIDPLLSSENEAIRYFCRRGLLNQDAGPVESLWQMPEAVKLFKKQLDNGSWTYPGGGKPHLRSQEDYSQLETFRTLGILVEKHGLTKRHPAIVRAANYLFSKQTKEGDFRGIYGHQYSPNYSAAIMELLIKAGYNDDTRIDKGFQWLVSMRQDDGGWAVPLRTAGVKLDAIAAEEAIMPDRSKPSSHWATGVVLRAFRSPRKAAKDKHSPRCRSVPSITILQERQLPRQTGRRFLGTVLLSILVHGPPVLTRLTFPDRLQPRRPTRQQRNRMVR